MFLDDLLIQFPPSVQNGSFSGLKMWNKTKILHVHSVETIYKSLS